MGLKEAIKILKFHQKWRQGKENDMIYNPIQITQALDVLLDFVVYLSPED